MTRLVRDPMCGRLVDKRQAVLTGFATAHRGRVVYFCSCSCKCRFDGRILRFEASHAISDWYAPMTRQ